jgi:arylsulfatase A-like enzyme
VARREWGSPSWLPTADWKYIYHPSGDGSPSHYTAELYNLTANPLELRNLIAAPATAEKLAELKKELARLRAKHKAIPHHLPVDGIINVLPGF